MKRFNVIIVGGGSAGLACAVALSENTDIDILIIEASERVGKKLSATGNGQGNLGNCDTSLSHYRSGNLPVVDKIISRGLSPESVRRRIFGSMLFKCDDIGRVYPQSLQASSLTDILLRRLNSRGVQMLLSTTVLDIREGFIVDCGDISFSADFVVLATGGKAQRQFKTDGSAYKLAQNLGHKLTPTRPAIVQLKTDTKYTKGLKGIRANCFVKAIIGGKCIKSVQGDVIFTDYGVSGNAIFYLSSELSARGGTLSIDFLPDVSAAAVAEVLNSRLTEGTSFCDILGGILHNGIARAVLKRVGAEDVDSIVKTVKNFILEVTGTLGFDYAQVTQGGIDMRDIAENLESKLCKGLYFTGEILDVDGDCGGYNLHWAFASGVAVADDINSKFKK